MEVCAEQCGWQSGRGRPGCLPRGRAQAEPARWIRLRWCAAAGQRADEATGVAPVRSAGKCRARRGGGARARHDRLGALVRSPAVGADVRRCRLPGRRQRSAREPAVRGGDQVVSNGAAAPGAADRDGLRAGLVLAVPAGVAARRCGGHPGTAGDDRCRRGRSRAASGVGTPT